MSAPLGTKQCVELDCKRARATSAQGRVVYSRCWAHTALLMARAFGPIPPATAAPRASAQQWAREPG